jgi:hypothetical protein
MSARGLLRRSCRPQVLRIEGPSILWLLGGLDNTVFDRLLLGVAVWPLRHTSFAASSCAVTVASAAQRGVAL